VQTVLVKRVLKVDQYLMKKKLYGLRLSFSIIHSLVTTMHSASD